MELGSTDAQPGIRRDAQQNRHRILDIARARIAAGDYSLPLNLVAREAGLGVGTVYRHFPTSQSLLESATVDGFDEDKEIAEAEGREPDARKALRLLVDRTLECLERRPELTAVLESPEIACLEKQEAVIAKHFVAVGVPAQYPPGGELPPRTGAARRRRRPCAHPRARRE